MVEILLDSECRCSSCDWHPSWWPHHTSSTENYFQSRHPGLQVSPWVGNGASLPGIAVCYCHVDSWSNTSTIKSAVSNQPEMLRCILFGLVRDQFPSAAQQFVTRWQRICIPADLHYSPSKTDWRRFYSDTGDCFFTL